MKWVTHISCKKPPVVGDIRILEEFLFLPFCIKFDDRSDQSKEDYKLEWRWWQKQKIKQVYLGYEHKWKSLEFID